MRVFLAEDDAEMRRLLAGALTRDGHLVLAAATGATLLAALPLSGATGPLGFVFLALSIGFVC